MSNDLWIGLGIGLIVGWALTTAFADAALLHKLKTYRKAGNDSIAAFLADQDSDATEA